jgi:hypothetical protein
MKLTQEQLASLTKEQKLKLLDAIKEKKRRELERKPPFIPHPGQRRVIESKALERYLFCGNGFGKSTVMVNEVHWAATGVNDVTGERTKVPAKIVLVLDTPEKIEDFLAEYRRWHQLSDKQLHKRGKANYSEITYDNGSSVAVLTHEVSDLKAEGSQWTHVFMDEPVPQNLFVSILRGCRIKGRPAKILMAGTPVKAAWLRTDIYEPWIDGKLPFVECFTGDTDENIANLEDGWLERFTARLDEKEKAIRLKGQFFDIEGLALSHLFKPATHIVPSSTPWEHEWPCVVVFDPAPAKAHVAVLLGVNDQDQIFVVEEYKEKANGRDFCRHVIQQGWWERYRVVDIIYDSLGNSENLMGESYKPFGSILNEELSEAGIGRARATTFDEKSDEDFIERIKDALVIPKDGLPKLRFYSHCKGAIDDVKTVQWYEDKKIRENKPKLDLRKKDFLACIKYALATNLFFDKPRRMKPHYYTKQAYGFKLGGSRTMARYKPGKPNDKDEEW